jgi:alanine racemase
MATLSAGWVLVRGRRVALLGPLSLEHARLDLSTAPEAEPGDQVVIIGAQGDERITVAEVLAANPGLPETALALQVGGSVRRVYAGLREPRDRGGARTAERRRRPSRPGRRSAAGGAG